MLAPHPLLPVIRTILVVDANPSVTETLRYIMTSCGYNVVTAAGGAEALARAKEQTMDGALIDVHMPGMNGIEVCRTLLDHSSATGLVMPVWLITGALTAEIHNQAAAAGALAVLAKPFNIQELVERLHTQFAPANPARRCSLGLKDSF